MQDRGSLRTDYTSSDVASSIAICPPLRRLLARTAACSNAPRRIRATVCTASDTDDKRTRLPGCPQQRYSCQPWACGLHREPARAYARGHRRRTRRKQHRASLGEIKPLPHLLLNTAAALHLFCVRGNAGKTTSHDLRRSSTRNKRLCCWTAFSFSRLRTRDPTRILPLRAFSLRKGPPTTAPRRP